MLQAPNSTHLNSANWRFIYLLLLIICVQITAFKPFFISLTLPYSTKRAEEFVLQVTVFNYLSDPLKVVQQLRRCKRFIGTVVLLYSRYVIIHFHNVTSSLSSCTGLAHSLQAVSTAFYEV